MITYFCLKPNSSKMKSVFDENTICRLCLRINEKVYRINNPHHKAFIESIIKLKQNHYVPTDDEYICYICNSLLRKAYNFMNTVWNAQEIICVILKNANKISKQLLEHLDRHNNGLNPINLSSVVICEICLGPRHRTNDCIFNLKISKQLLEHLDRHNNGLNPINLSSVVICEKLNEDSFHVSNASTDSEELNLHRLIDKREQNKAKQEYKNNSNLNKTKNHFTNDKLLTISVSSSSDEDKQPEIYHLDEVEVEIDEIKTEISDPLTKDLSTDDEEDGDDDNDGDDKHDDPKPAPKKQINIRRKFPINKATSGEKEGNHKKQRDKDEDYQPDSTSHSEDSDFDSYDDEGKSIKRPTDTRIYPRKCDHCDHEILVGRTHYHHYMFEHPNIEYPYKLEKEYACSICGKMFSKQKIGLHERSHVILKLKCPSCPNVFPNKNRLNRHKLRVHPKTKFICDYCSKPFKTRGDITLHLRIHTGSKPFKCHICEESFAHSGNRTIHIRAKHQNIKYVPKKHKPAVKHKRRNKKHYSTDTEYSSDNKKTKRGTRKKTKRETKKKTKQKCKN